MQKIMLLIVLLALGGCVGADGRPVLGAKDEDQVFTFIFNGSAAKGGSCWAEGSAGKVESSNDLFGFPQVTIRGHVRTGMIYCRTGAGATYVTRVNQAVVPGWRTPSANASSNPVYASPAVRMQTPNGERYFPNAMVRVN